MKNFDKYSPGDVVLVKFPFSDLLNFKVRPAVVLKDQKDDLLLVPVSSKISGNKMVKQLKDADLTGQKLPVQSVIRYTKLFTLNKRIVYKKLSALKQDSMSGLLETVLAYLKSKD